VEFFCKGFSSEVAEEEGIETVRQGGFSSLLAERLENVGG